MKNINLQRAFFGFMIASVLCLAGCNVNDPIYDGNGGGGGNTEGDGGDELTAYSIAIVLPQKGAYWKNAIEWPLQELNDVPMKTQKIKVVAEWYDEEEGDMETLFSELAGRDDIRAIIGPLYSENAQIAARECARSGKTLIPATASSELLMRAFSGKDFLWCLTENDISQCELLLTLAREKGAQGVSLLTNDNIYGSTFLDWFAFQARELGLKIDRITMYSDQNLETTMQRMLNSGTDCLICIPSGKQAAAQMQAVRSSYTGTAPMVLFSDVALLVEADAALDGMEGISQAPDPESGFCAAYETRYGSHPGYGFARFYDAVILAGLGILEAELAGEDEINTALKRIVQGDGEQVNTCSAGGASRIVSSLINRRYPQISGASGSLRFDDTFTGVLRSAYCHWTVTNGTHRILEYITSDEGNRPSGSSPNWSWTPTGMQDFDKNSQISYNPKKESYALIIAASSSWNNYRHQAGAYAFYQMLKTNGMDDDHILLISEDDIANNPLNPNPGFISSPTGEGNLYDGVQVDYRPSELNFGDLINIFTDGGDFKPGRSDNLLVYWAGHGEPEGPMWLNNIIPANQVADLFKRLSQDNYFRKLLLFMDTDYSGKVGIACPNLFGMLYITATNDRETAKPGKTDGSGMWISNSFTDAVLGQLSQSGNTLTYYDLYANVYQTTIGSHVTVYNSPFFGNLYTTTVREFIYP